jgi:hypothetical protein
VVGGCVIRDTRRPQGTHWGNDAPRTRICHWHVKKQKLNTKSSTKYELVGVDNASPQMMWTRYFVEGQGYGVEASILNEDNLSAMLLGKNGRASSKKGPITSTCITSLSMNGLLQGR